MDSCDFAWVPEHVIDVRDTDCISHSNATIQPIHSNGEDHFKASTDQFALRAGFREADADNSGRLGPRTALAAARKLLADEPGQQQLTNSEPLLGRAGERSAPDAGQEGRIRLPKACVIVETTADTCGKYHFGKYKLNTNETRRLSKECFGNRVAVFDFMVACAEPMALGKFITCTIEAVYKSAKPRDKKRFNRDAAAYKICVARRLKGTMEVDVPTSRSLLDNPQERMFAMADEQPPFPSQQAGCK
ncbi:hypothetical protein ISCGN_022398 [Ixodes scapularis]